MIQSLYLFALVAVSLPDLYIFYFKILSTYVCSIFNLPQGSVQSSTLARACDFFKPKKVNYIVVIRNFQTNKFVKMIE